MNGDVSVDDVLARLFWGHGEVLFCDKGLESSIKKVSNFEGENVFELCVLSDQAKCVKFVKELLLFFFCLCECSVSDESFCLCVESSEFGVCSENFCFIF